jgi:hypothetical protein
VEQSPANLRHIEYALIEFFEWHYRAIDYVSPKKKIELCVLRSSTLAVISGHMATEQLEFRKVK